MKRHVLLVLILAPFSLVAQWSSDPSQNLTIFPGADLNVPYRTGGTIQGCSDGSVYITHFDLGNNLHVRRLDKDGFDLWTPDLVTFHVTGYPEVGSFIDARDNLYINIAREQPDIYGYEFILFKVDKTGNKIFGDDGIVFQNPERYDNQYYTHYSVTDQEEVLFSYFRVLGDSLARIIHRIARDGSLPWGENGLILPAYIVSDLILSGHEGFYLVNGKYIGVHHDDWRYEVYVRKYNMEGKSVWGRDIMVFKGYMSSGKFNFLSGCCDDFYMGYQPSWIQHMNSDGSTEWEGGGLAVIDDSTANPVTPQFAGLNSKGELMVYFSRSDSKGKNPQLYGQLIGNGGERLWGDAGRPIGIADFSGVGARMNRDYRLKLYHDTVYLFYRYPLATSDRQPSSLRVMAIDGEGGPAWPQPVELTTERPFNTLPFVTDFVDNQVIMMWAEQTATKKGILKAQNVRTNGSIGVTSGGIRDEVIARKHSFTYDPETRTVRFIGFTYPERFSLRNLSGQSVCAGPAGQEIHLPALTQGIYVLTLLNGSNVIESCRINIR